mmetsp:Transcript_12043/g.22405  ORF Transcript_12043/g.22405 Transcript_12043/m.22405 type:complete len:438 (-) Transcript_12043:177-1490(-)
MMTTRKLRISSPAMTRRRISMVAATTVLAIMALLSSSATVEAFTTPSSINTRTNNYNALQRSPSFQPPSRSSPPSSSTSLNFGGDGGILGVGTPEIAVIVIVGYFVLGPSDLYKLVKEIGKTVQNLRTLGTEATKQFEGTMENQLELTELRKAQAELNDAFSFRRSINTDATTFGGTETGSVDSAAAELAGGPFGAAATAVAGAVGEATSTEEGEEVAAAAAPIKKKRRLVRRKKKKVVEEIDVPSEEDMAMEYPDLDMLDAELSEEDKRRAERLDRLSGGESSSDSESTSGEPDWFTASEEDIASEVLDNDQPRDIDPALESFEKQRFQTQLSADDWNSQIMANEDELAPLSMVMKRLAILEDEKNAADKRLEEEYGRRMENEDRYYMEKREALMDAITEIQEDVYGGGGGEKKENEGEGEKKAVEIENIPPQFTV